MIKISYDTSRMKQYILRIRKSACPTQLEFSVTLGFISGQLVQKELMQSLYLAFWKQTNSTWNSIWLWGKVFSILLWLEGLTSLLPFRLQCKLLAEVRNMDQLWSNRWFADTRTVHNNFICKYWTMKEAGDIYINAPCQHSNILA